MQRPPSGKKRVPSVDDCKNCGGSGGPRVLGVRGRAGAADTAIRPQEHAVDFVSSCDGGVLVSAGGVGRFVVDVRIICDFCGGKVYDM